MESRLLVYYYWLVIGRELVDFGGWLSLDQPVN